MKAAVSLAVLLALLAVARGQQGPSFTASATVQLTSNALPATQAAVIDGNDTTAWQSGANFPYGYVSRADLNILLNLCSGATAARCTASTGSKNLAGATDGNNANTATIAKPAGAPAQLRLALPGGPLPLRRVSLRPIITATAPVTVSLQLAGGSTIAIGTLNSTTSYSWVALVGQWQGVTAIQLTSAGGGFTVTDIAATSAPSFEQATVDLGSARLIGIVRTRHWAGSDGLNTTLLHSQDGVSFSVLQVLDPSRLSAQTLTLATPVTARYLAVRHLVREADWAKVYVWGIDAWAPPPPSPPPPSPPPPSPSLEPLPDGWNPLAGSVESFTYNKPVTVSTHDADTDHIVDGMDNTQWQSDACFPNAYTARDDMNPLKGACAQGRCQASAGTTKLADCTDQDVYTGAFVTLPAGTPAGQAGAFVQAALPAPTSVRVVTVKGFGKDVPINVLLVKADGSSVKVGAINPATDNYQWLNFWGQWDGVVAARVESTAGFTLTELAVESGPCTQWASVDMQQARQVGMIRVRFWAPDAAETKLLTSVDGQSWTLLRTFSPATLPAVDVWLDELTPIRYIKIKHTITDTSDWKKVYVWGIDAYDQFGQWGPPPAPVRQSRTFRQLLGLNGIWGWGSQMFSDTAAQQGKGPLYYNQVASAGRNYHEMSWDVKWPNRDPHYDTMKTKGTDGQWWLDWDREYGAWKAAGMRVHASFQFNSDVFPPSAWGSDPYTTAWNLGNKFAKHFGPTNGTGTVSAVEFGNEPWGGYNATWYAEALRGWVDGAKAGDPTLPLLPCALQADNPNGEDSNSGNFIGARVKPRVAAKLDALNYHTYSFFRLDDGTRIYVQPEHPGSNFNGINNFLAWRNTNMPGTPVWVTEWGWDAHLPGEPCGGTECVSQYAKAVYAVRGLMVLARKGVAQTHWFFYADGDDCNTLFCRSGVRGSNSTNFPVLPVYKSMTGLLQLAGSSVFAGVVEESKDVFAYLLASPGGGLATHLIAWRPVEAGEGREPTASARLALPVALQGAQPQQAWVIDGQGADGYHAAGALPSLAADGASWQMDLSSAPLLVKLP